MLGRPRGEGSPPLRYAGRARCRSRGKRVAALRGTSWLRLPFRTATLAQLPREVNPQVLSGPREVTHRGPLGNTQHLGDLAVRELSDALEAEDEALRHGEC